MEDHRSDVEKLYDLMKEDKERRAKCQRDVEALLTSIKDKGKDYSLKLMSLYDVRRWCLVDASFFLYEDEIFNDLMGAFLSMHNSMKEMDYLSAYETLQNSTFCKLCMHYWRL